MKLENVRTICSLGTGTMGPGITLTFALAGYPVQMYGRSAKSIKGSLHTIEEIMQSFLKHGLIQPAEIPAIIGRIKAVTTLEEAAEGADFVVEAIIEDLAVKQELLAEMERLCSSRTVFASSTSGLSTTALAAKLTHKDRFIVAHFWNPPHLIPLVEVVPGEQTSQETIELTSALLAKTGKKPVTLKKEALGFIGNRLQFAMLREAFLLIEEGIADKEAVDDTIKYALGRRLAVTGPFESADLSGLDIIHNIADYLFMDLSNSREVSPILQENISKGRLGAKTKSGFYDWTADSLPRIKKLREENLIEWLRKDKNSYLDYLS